MDDAGPLNWEEHISAGWKYLRTAGNGLARPSVFNNELVYQLIALAVEKLLVGIFQYHQKMPADHTLNGLVDELAQFCPLEAQLADGIKKMGRFDDMCPLIPVNKIIPDDEDIRTMLDVGRQVAAFADLQIFERRNQ